MPRQQTRISRMCLSIAVAVACFAAPAFAEPTKVGKIEDGKVCFGDKGCVKVGAGSGRLGEGAFAGASEWIVEVRDDSGKVIDRVKPGGEIVFISPETYAKRDGGQKTFTIARVDKAIKPVKTNFVFIQNHLRRTNWYHWSGVSGGAFGMTALPAQSLRTMVAGDIYRTQVRGRLLAGGNITGISEDGALTDTFSDVVAVQAYGDYNILMFNGGKDHQVADWAMRALSPRTDNIHAFAPAYKESSSHYGSDWDVEIDYPAVMFGVASGTLGNGKTIYQLLPRRRGETYPPELIGFLPLRTWKQSFNPCPFGIDMERCTLSIAAFGAMWATPKGPEMTLHNFNGEPVNRDRYRAVDWWGGHESDFGVVEELTGEAHLVAPVLTGPHYLQFPALIVGEESYAGIEAARSEIYRQDAAKSEVKRAAILADEAKRAAELAASERNAAYWAQVSADRRIALEQLEAVELVRARELEQFSTDQWQTVCQEAMAMQTLFARNIALSRCGDIKPVPYQAPKKRDFWGDLSLALDAWSSLSAQGAGAGYASVSPPAGVSPDWDYARSMKSIDNTVRTVTDPNWNGAAARASGQ